MILTYIVMVYLSQNQSTPSCCTYYLTSETQKPHSPPARITVTGGAPRKMPHRTRPMTALLVFTGLNAVLFTTISPVYDFVCFLPYWERRVIYLFVYYFAYLDFNL